MHPEGREVPEMLIRNLQTTSPCAVVSIVPHNAGTA